MKPLSFILIFSLFFINILFAQKTELTPNNITLTKNGIDVSSIYVSSKKGDPSDGVFKYGEKLFIDFSDITGLTKVEDKYHPIIDLTILSKKADTIYHNIDMNIYGLNRDFISIDSNSLQVPILPYYLFILLPGVYLSKEYTLFCTVRDSKSKNQLQMKMDFKFSPNPNPYLTVQKKGLEYSEVSLHSRNNEEMLIDNIIRKNDYLVLTLKDIDGYTVKDDKATFSLNYTFTNESGEIIADKQIYLSSVCKNGKIIESNMSIPIEIIGIESIKPNNTVILNLKISDRNSDHLFDISTTLFITE